MTMASRSFHSLGPQGFHRIAYTEWGDPANGRVLLCVHGLTRTGRDFDAIAAALADEWRVICPDIVGRGASDRLPDARGYDYGVYCADMAALIARSGAETVDWLGTSMGGIIGMMLAAQPNAPIRRLVLNDIGPVIATAGLERIASYVGRDPLFRSFDEAYQAIRGISAAFGPMTEEDWRRFVEASLVAQPGGGFRLNYDPQIAWPFREQPVREIQLWELWDAIRCPVLVLRGAESDLLRAETLEEMRRRGPGCEAVEIAGVGHCPALMDSHQIETVRRFLA